VPRFAVKDIKPNPFRHMDRYPIRSDKVEALRESLRTTGFWDNVLARIGEDGNPEIAYGHHRLKALQDEYGPDKKVNLIIRDLSDESMIKIMVRENMEEWGSSAWIEQENIRAVVGAYAEGKIELPELGGKVNKDLMRHAPSFKQGDAPVGMLEHPYTAQSVATFLGLTEENGQPSRKVRESLVALEFIEEGILNERDFEQLKSTEAYAVVSQARQAKKQRENRAQTARTNAKVAEEDAKRHEASRQAAVTAQEAKAAEEQRKAAERRQRAEEAKAVEEQEQASKEASLVGKAVGDELRGGGGVKNVGNVRDQVVEKREPTVGELNDLAGKFARDLCKILDPDYDIRAKKLNELAQYQDSISTDVMMQLDTALAGVAQRAQEFRENLTRQEGLVVR